jgi:hypothetical protein
MMRPLEATRASVSLPDRMTRANLAHMAVVPRADQRPIGYVSWRDLLRARSRTKEEEMQRVLPRCANLSI